MHTPGEDIKKMHAEENCSKALQNRRKIEKYFPLPLRYWPEFTPEKGVSHTQQTTWKKHRIKRILQADMKTLLGRAKKAG